MTEFRKRIYYRLEMTLVSPLSIGSGDNLNTDHDVIVDANGNPFIPATAIAGVFRSSFQMKDAVNIFGYIPTSKNDTYKETVGSVRFYDARLSGKNEQIFITTRDSVKLKNKIGVPGAKFDMQVVEPGITFVSYIELLDSKYATEFEKALTKVDAGILRFGSKTTRGYGQVNLSVKQAEISDFETYLNFAVFDEEKWKDIDDISLPIVEDIEKKITLSLISNGGISIREYSTDINMPDYKTISLHGKSGKKDIPVIPGTSWAGAIRSRFEEIIGENKFENEKDKTVSNNLFGFVNSNKKDVSIKSKIIFSETKISGGTYKESTRNSIDRFSATTKKGALYTERTYYGGKTKLEIIIKKELDEQEKFALATTIADLNNGFLAVGGLTSIGRGLFTVNKVNGSEETAKKLSADTLDIGGFIKEVF